MLNKHTPGVVDLKAISNKIYSNYYIVLYQ